MKLVSWNVNGLRACIQKGFLEQFDKLDADFFCLQETKLSQGQLELNLPGYLQYWCYADKKGYSGTAVFTKHTPESVHYGLGIPELDNEGRLITLEYPEFFLVTCYTPNAQRGLARLDHRMTWDEAFRAYLQKLDSQKPVILCGDLNVAHQEIDLKNPKSNHGNAGFSDEERASFQKTLDLGFTDTFRYLHPDATGCYSWWSYMFHARENNAGWRIDYFLVSDRIKESVYRAEIHSDILGSDHCPVSAELDLSCNGGIWSPAPLGKAEVKGNPAPKADKGASAVKAKALAAFSVGIVLLIAAMLFFLPRVGTNPGVSEAPVIISVFDFPPWAIMDTEDASLSSDLQYAERLTDGVDIFYINSLNTELLLRSNVCVRVDITHTGHEMNLDEYGCEFRFIPEAQGSPGSGTDLDEVSLYGLITVPYYSDSTKTDHLGWLLFGTVSEASQFQVELVDSNQKSILFESVSLDPVRILNEESLIFNTKHYDSPFILVQIHLYTEDMYSSTLINCYEIRNGDDVYYTTDPPTDIEDSTFTFTVLPDSAVFDAAHGASCSIRFEPISYTTNEDSQVMPITEQAFDLKYQLVYQDITCTEPIGWVVYGNKADIAEVRAELSYNNPNGKFQYETVISLVDCLPSRIAETMDTPALLDYIMNHNIGDSIVQAEDISKLSHVPVLAELVTREDAVQTLMDYDVLSASICRTEVPLLLLEYQPIYEAMSPRQFAYFVAHDFQSYPFGPVELELDLEGDPANLATASLALRLYTLTERHAAMVYRGSSTEQRQEILLYIYCHCTALREFLSRENALQEIRWLQEKMDYRLNILSIAEYYWSFITGADPDLMTTQQMVDYIMASKQYLSAVSSSGSHMTESYYQRYYKDYPLLLALPQREDSLDVLMSYDASDLSHYQINPWLLMTTIPFRKHMTPKQECDVLLRLYDNSCIPPDEWNDTLENAYALTTAQLVEWIHQNLNLPAYYLSQCTVEGSQLCMYGYFRYAFSALPALEQRQDALQLLQQASSGADKYNMITYLTELWPQIIDRYAREALLPQE